MPCVKVEKLARGESWATRFQNSRMAASRSLGALPAMSEALIAPMEVPMTQSGSMPAPWSASVHPCLVGAERATALQHQHHLPRKHLFVSHG